MSNTKSVHFKCEKMLVDELDRYRNRYVCRTELLEVAVKRYLNFLRERGGTS